jgi:hypothetical protein
MHEHLVAFSCKRRGFCPSCGARRPDNNELNQLLETLSRRIVRALELR